MLNILVMADQTISPNFPNRDDYVSWTATYQDEIEEVCRSLGLPEKFVRVLLTPTEGNRRHSVQENVYNAHVGKDGSDQPPSAELMKRAFRYKNKNPYSFFGSLWSGDISLYKSWRMADDNNKRLMTQVFEKEEVCKTDSDIEWDKYA